MNNIRTNAAVIIFVLFVATGIGVSIYNFVFSPDDSEVKQLIIKDCHQTIGRSLIAQDFMKTAANARRSQAAAESAEGMEVQSLNDLAAARQYEKYIDKYDAFTPKDCDTLNP